MGQNKDNNIEEEVQSLINQYIIDINNSNEQIIIDLSTLIIDDKLTLLQFVQNIGKFLTQDNELMRSKSVLLISLILDKLPSNKLAMKDSFFLMGFLINRLSDNFNEASVGILSLILMNNFKSTEVIADLLSTLKENYDSRQLLAKQRYVAFGILLNLFNKFENFILSNLNNLFIETFIKVSTSEKDPRNLLISFELNYKISTSLDINKYSEELFDNSFCYFPISFKPPPNDPYKITSDELKSALRKILSCNSIFAKDSIPNLTQKLTSSSPLVKADALNNLIACIQNYNVKTVKEYSISLWNAIKFEILHNELSDLQSYEDLIKNYENSSNDEDKIIPLSLKLIEQLTVKVTSNDDGIEEYVTIELIIDELIKNLTAPDAKYSKQSALILASMSSTSIKIFNLTVAKSFPIILLCIKEGVSVPKQRALIINLSFFLYSYTKLSQNHQFPNNLEILKHKDDIFMLLSKSLMSSSKNEVTLRCLAISNLFKLVKMKDFLSYQEANLIVQYFTEVLIDDTNPTTFKEVLEKIVSVSSIEPKLILEITVPQLLALLPDSDSNEIQKEGEISLKVDNHSTVKSKESLLKILSSMVENKEILDVLMIRLLHKLNTLLSNNSSIEYIKYLILTMIEILTKTSKTMENHNQQLEIDNYLKTFLPQFLYLILQNDIFHSKENYGLLEVSSKLAKLIVINTNSSKHQVIVDSLFKIFVYGDSSSSEILLTRPLNYQIKLLEQPSNLVNLFIKLLSAVDKSTTKLPVDIHEYIRDLIKMCQLDVIIHEDYERLGYLQNLCLVIDKYLANTNEEHEFLSLLFNELTEPIELNSTAVLSNKDLKNLEVLAWITKALILKNDSSSDNYREYLIKLLDFNRFSSVSSKLIEVLVSKSEIFNAYKKSVKNSFGLNKKIIFNININLLFKQKFFNDIIPKLIASFNSTPSAILKKNYVATLSLILKYVDDDSIILPHLPTIFPALVSSLYYEPNSESDKTIIKSSLKIILITLKDESSSKKLILENIKRFVPRFLELINSTNDGDIKVYCLQCLMKLPEVVDSATLADFKSGILRNLIPVLDDRKRIVRKIASDCRQIYYDLA
ncbi:hypothetical protein PACTADRAFT_49118 [Pachysolen tannophilus NRRL Y-2460]|uniref:MMS19 nucleotide excision repair protein n=1 Tax=Pachysolen tannophilus NRRL Y-2460 TaxID=669874 RepID=A0A1E4U079_PACTA|nr:hypothetical protein PACTADRAFT_49118 [Pachysolen tannophilus NRRL Y-2460]